MTIKKICGKCKKEKPITDFYKTLNGHRSLRCKECKDKELEEKEDDDDDFWEINEDAIYC